MASKKPAPEGPVEVPDVISILPLRNSVLFPGSIIPIDVGRKKSVKLVEEAISKERPVIGIVTQRDARTEDPGAGDMYTVGCAARILKVIKLAKDNFSVILQGVSRIRLLETARAGALHDRPGSGAARSRPARRSSSTRWCMNLKDIAKQVIQLMPELPAEASALIDSSPSRASWPTSSPRTSTSRSTRSSCSRRSTSRSASARCCSSSRASSRS